MKKTAILTLLLALGAMFVLTAPSQAALVLQTSMNSTLTAAGIPWTVDVLTNVYLATGVDGDGGGNPWYKYDYVVTNPGATSGLPYHTMEGFSVGNPDAYNIEAQANPGGLWTWTGGAFPWAGSANWQHPNDGNTLIDFPHGYGVGTFTTWSYAPWQLVIASAQDGGAGPGSGVTLNGQTLGPGP